MQWNIGLAIVAALSQLGNAFMGWKVTGQDLSTTQRRIYDGLFIVIGLLGVGSVGLLAYRGGRQERAHYDASVRNVSQIINTTNGQVVPYSWFIVGKPLAFNIALKQVGNGTAYNVDRSARAFIEPDTSINSQAQAVSAFTRWLATDRNDMRLTDPKDSEGISTAWGDILTPEDLENLKADRRTSYVVARIQYADDFGSHVFKVCQYMEPQPNLPNRPNTIVAVLEIWSHCEVYDGEDTK